ncbi:MAG: protein-export chaperone SecB [Kiloniellaceae bacterium]
MADPQGEQSLVIHTQYIKDLSFENPNAPEVFAALVEHHPEVNVNIDVNARLLGERTYESAIALRVDATIDERAGFLIEMEYAGVVSIGATVPEDQIEPLVLAETPRFLFPFARATLADITRDGGFPPLVINPIDFEQFYRRHKVGALAAAQAETADAAADETPAKAADGTGAAQS